MDDVLSFQSNTAKNQIDLSNLLQSIPVGKALNIKSVVVTAQGGQPVNFSVSAFTRSGSTLLLSDNRVNATLGVTIELVYELN